MIQILVLVLLISLNAFFAAAEMAFVSLNDAKIEKESKSGNIVIQPDSKIFGRSVYLCYNENCINTVLKKGINKPLKANISREDLKGLLDGQLKS